MENILEVIGMAVGYFFDHLMFWNVLFAFVMLINVTMTKLLKNKEVAD